MFFAATVGFSGSSRFAGNVPAEPILPSGRVKLPAVNAGSNAAKMGAGMLQDQVANELGTSQTTISEVELGQRGGDLLGYQRLVGVYGADWPAFIDELERRLAAAPHRADSLIRRARMKSEK